MLQIVATLLTLILQQWGSVSTHDFLNFFNTAPGCKKNPFQTHLSKPICPDPFVQTRGQNIVDKFTKLTKIVISMEYFTAHFLQFSNTIVKISLLVTGWVFAIISKNFRDIHEIFKFPKILSLNLFRNSWGELPFDNNSLVLFPLQWSEIVQKC